MTAKKPTTARPLTLPEILGDWQASLDSWSRVLAACPRNDDVTTEAVERARSGLATAEHALRTFQGSIGSAERERQSHVNNA
jgi:hypothetical protein